MNTAISDAVTLRELFRRKSSALSAQLTNSEDMREAADVIVRTLHQLCMEYREKNPEADMERLNGLFLVLEQAVVAGATSASCRVTALPIQARTKGSRTHTAMRYAPIVLCGALAAYLLLNGQPYPAIAALLAAGLSLLGIYKKDAAQAEPGQSRATPMLEQGEWMRRMDALFRDMDDMLRVPDKRMDEPKVSRAMCEALQMLLEAKTHDDGAFALTSVSQWVMAFEKEGLRCEMYSDDVRNHFDLLPGVCDAETIRPAILKGDELLARGQATMVRK